MNMLWIVSGQTYQQLPIDFKTFRQTTVGNTQHQTFTFSYPFEKGQMTLSSEKNGRLLISYGEKRIAELSVSESFVWREQGQALTFTLTETAVKEAVYYID